MPSKYVHLRVFISSPADVQEERQAARDVIQELNALNGPATGIWLEPIGWEDSVYSDFGADAQDVINSQVGDWYDIFIGILWMRLGTPTPRANSGTIEEFERALARHKADPESVSIGFYFKDEKVSPTSIDYEQAAAVQKFRKTLPEMGGLYRTFTTLDDFKSLLRLQLNGNAQKWAKGVVATNSNQTTTAKEDEPTEVSQEQSDSTPEGDEDLGFLDYRETFERSAKELNVILENIGGAFNAHTRAIEARTTELDDLNQRGTTVTELKAINNKTADDLIALAKAITPLVKDYSHSFDVVVDSMSHLATFPGISEGEQTALENLQAVQQLISRIEETQVSISSYAQSITSIPRMTTHLNRAKKSAAQTLNVLYEDTSKRLTVLREVESELRRRVETPS